MKTGSVGIKFFTVMFGFILLLGGGVAQAASNCFSIKTVAGQSGPVLVTQGSDSPGLVATCEPSTASYVWKVGNVPLSCTGSTCTVPTAKIPNIGDYVVTAAVGTGGAAANITLTVTPVMADCWSTYGVVDFSDPVTRTTKQVTLTAKCNPGTNRSTAPDKYEWKANGNIIAGNDANLLSHPDTAKTASLTVKVAAEGTEYGVTNISVANDPARKAFAVFSGAPDCTLEVVSPGTPLTSGASAVLMATCDAATSIDWYADQPAAKTLFPAPPGGIVTPKVTTKYYVVGNNAYGSSGSNEVTVTVNPAAPPVPTCSPTATPATVGVNNPTTLTANCSGATSFAWTSESAGHGLPTANTLSTIFATPSSSGTKTYTVTGTNGSSSGTASVNVIVSSLPTSDCTEITPFAPSVASGTATALTATTCSNNPSASGYAWTIAKGTAAATSLTCTGKSCTVPGNSLATAGTYTVKVTNNNGQGPGGAATATITVSAAPKSDCTLITPAAPSVALGVATALTATTCSNSPSASGYAWTIAKGTAAATPLSCTGQSCTVPGNSLATAGTYTVKVTNDNGQGPGLAATAKITVSAAPKSDCTSITPETTAIAPGKATSFSAACNNSPAATGYSWKVRKGTATPTIVTGCTGSSCTVPGTKFGTEGTYYVTVTNNNGKGAGLAATATVTVTNGYVPVVKCPPLTITEKAFDFINPGGSQHVKMNRGQAIAFKFTTDASGKAGTIETSQSTTGLLVYRYMVVSETKCDFSYVPYDTRNGCAGNGNIKYTTGAKQAYYCPLKPNTTYYANIRNENASPSTRGTDTCPTGQPCGFVGAIY